MSRTKRALSVAGITLAIAVTATGVASASDHSHHHDKDNSGLLSILDIHLGNAVRTVVNVAKDAI